MGSSRSRAVLLVFALCFPAHAGAQFVGGAPAQDAPQAVLTPPTIAEYVEAAYPEEARAQGLSAAVDLLLTVAADGTVADAVVESPVGHGFDEAALDAVKRFRFQPATRNGEPVASRIRYRYEFKLPEPPPPEPPPPPSTGRIAGQVLSDKGDAPVVHAVVVITNPETQHTRGAVTDTQGRFVVERLAAGRYRLEVSVQGVSELIYQEEVQAGEETAVTYRLRPEQPMVPNAGPAEYGARAVVEPPTRELTRRSLDKKLLYRIPGTSNDPIRGIEVLPGISRPPFGSGQLIIRGASPSDSLVFIDGAPVPALYHFGGLRSVYNGQLLSRMSLYPGNFSSRFGRLSGGVVEIETRDPATDRLHGVVENTGIDASILLEGPISRKFAVAVAFRRSLIDIIAAPILKQSNSGFTALPAYYDYQFVGTWRPTSQDQVRFQFYGANDHFALVAKDASEADASAAKNSLDLTNRFNFGQVTWNRQFSGGKTTQFVTLQTGPTHNSVHAGDSFHLDLDVNHVYGRAQWVTRLNSWMRLVSGLDLNSGTYRARYVGPGIGQNEGNPNAGNDQPIGVRARGMIMQPGAYADLGTDLGPFTINAALRADYYDEIRNYSVDPRLVLEYRLHPMWSLKGAAGLYSQPPQFEDSNRTIGNSHLKPIRTAHYGTALYFLPSEGMKFGLEGFYKPIWHNVVSGETPNQPAYTNGGIGRIYGLEASAMLTPSTAPYVGILSYTLLNSERKDHPDQPWRRFDYQQTHGLNVAFLYTFRKRNWEIGSTVRFFSGNPYTPVVGRIWNATERSYQPILGAVNSAQNPNFNRIDLRIMKTWQRRKYSIAAFLDVQNLLNHQNQEAVFYNYDSSRRGVIHGLPIIPALGMRGQF